MPNSVANRSNRIVHPRKKQNKQDEIENRLPCCLRLTRYMLSSFQEKYKQEGLASSLSQRAFKTSALSTFHDKAILLLWLKKKITTTKDSPHHHICAGSLAPPSSFLQKTTGAAMQDGRQPLLSSNQQLQKRPPQYSKEPLTSERRGWLALSTSSLRAAASFPSALTQ